MNLDASIERFKNKQLNLMDNENKNQQIECGTLVNTVACSRIVSCLVTPTND